MYGYPIFQAPASSLPAFPLLIASYVLIAMSMLVDDGRYNLVSLLFALAGFVTLLWSVWRARRTKRPRFNPSTILAAAVAALLLMGVRADPGIYIAMRAFVPMYRIATAIMLLLVACFYMTPLRSSPARRWAFLLVLTMAFALRLAIPVVSPSPIIDVFTTIQESSQHLLSGLNPYTTPVSDVYNGSAFFGYAIKAYMYPPANLYLHAPAFSLTGDARFASVLAEMFFVFFLWRIAPKAPKTIAELLVLLFLAHPRGLFILEQSWTEPLLLAFFGWFLILEFSGRRSTAAAVFGFLIALKQYLVIFALQLLLIERKLYRLLLVAVVALLTLLPFAVIDMEALWRNGIAFQLHTPFRADALTVGSFLYRTTGIVPAKWLGLIVALIAAAITAATLRELPRMTRYLSAVTITMYATFLFGGQAFTNYYYFLGGLELCLMTGGLRERAFVLSGPKRRERLMHRTRTRKQHRARRKIVKKKARKGRKRRRRI